MKGEYFPLIITVTVLIIFASPSLTSFITLFGALALLFFSELFSSILISSNLQKTSNHVREFLFLSLQKIFRNHNILTPTNDALLRSMLNQSINYSVELGSQTPLIYVQVENKELLEAEKALFQLDDKYALHLLIIFGFPFLYFILGLFFSFSSFNLV